MTPTLPNPDPHHRGAGVSWTRCVGCDQLAAPAPEQDRCPRCAVGGAQCAAAHPDDPSGCHGPADAVRVIDRTGDAVLGCIRHAAVLLASVAEARVYPATMDGAAIQAYRLSRTLAPFSIAAGRRGRS